MAEPLLLEPLFPDRTSGETLAAQLVRRLRSSIESGAIAPGTRMLGTRQLARRLGLGRNTVALVYEQLLSEGYFESRRGSGTFVSGAAFARSAPVTTQTAVASPDRAARIAALRDRFTYATGDGPLRPGMPAVALFPVAAWKRAARRALVAWDDDLSYAPAHGTGELRAAIANHVRQFRGVNALDDQVIVVEGAQAALHLASTVLACEGDAVVVEDPCYALARATFELHGFALAPVPVDDDGIRTELLPEAARFAYVTPAHQFPLGGALPLSRRLELLAWAGEQSAYVIEDDYDSEFTSRARPLPALQSLDRDERIVYVGTFSKTLAPGIRAGYLIVPPHLIAAFRAARATTSLGLSLALQATLARFIGEGHFARHIRKMNAIYERNRATLARALDPLRERGFRLGPMHVGLHVGLTSLRPFSDRSHRHLPDGQRLVAFSDLCLQRGDCTGFALGFSNGSESDIRDAAEQLVQALRRANV